MKVCPYCSKENSDDVPRCVCGYRFWGGGDEDGSVRPSGRSQRQHVLSAERVALTAVHMTWAETFALCLKLAICAIPAIWIAVLAYKIPEILLGAAVVAGSR